MSQSSTAIEQIIEGRSREVGGTQVRRVLPDARRRMIGPFVFFDHLGPLALPPGRGLDVAPHPHIGLATVTYLFAGAIVHRDSLGSVREIRPGDVNWMTAGRGIVHSERSPEAERRVGVRLHGIQSWVALPDGHEEDAPSFTHHAATDLPTLALDGVDMRVLAGEAFGQRSPAAVLGPTLYVDALMAAGSHLPIGTDYAERAIYVVDGAVEIATVTVGAGNLAVLRPDTTVAVVARTTARLMLLGGESFGSPRIVWWNFVAGNRERIERAKQDWTEQRFGSVPGERERLPLPD